MNEKIHLSKKLLFLVIIFLAAIPFFIKVGQAENPGIDVTQWEDVHKSRVEGECADCHSGLDYVEQKVVPGKTRMIPPPKNHTDKFVRFTHGKTRSLGSQSCSACHQKQECVNCHASLPESHSSDFVSPYSDTDGAQRHIALGRADITSCFACHRNFSQECSTCHEYGETRQWQSTSEEALQRWKTILDMQP